MTMERSPVERVCKDLMLWGIKPMNEVMKAREPKIYSNEFIFSPLIVRSVCYGSVQR
jgi:hypothetical protein